MKKIPCLLIVLMIALASCKKYSVDKQNATDDAAITAYLKANNITAIKDESGLYYKIINPGSGAHPTASSSVNVGYVGSKLDGAIFDQSTSTGFDLPGVIVGWQIGIPKIAAGGEVMLYIPSTLGYGNQKVGALDKNTVLIFDVKLISFF